MIVSMSASIIANGYFSVLHTTQFGLVVKVLTTNEADLYGGYILLIGLLTLGFCFGSADADSDA